MARNQPSWPREWLMTDERMGDRLWQAIDALPTGAGIIFRHYATPVGERNRMAKRVADICRDRGLRLAIARDVLLAESMDAELVHNPVGDASALPVSRSAHSFEEAEAAWQAGASLVFLSPIFPTRSHPDRPPLPRAVRRRIIAACPVPVIALGGVNRERLSEFADEGLYGWAGIDAWLGA